MKTLAVCKEDNWTVETLDPASVEAEMDKTLSAEDRMRKELWEKVRANCAVMRTSASKGRRPNFGVVRVRDSGISQHAR